MTSELSQMLDELMGKNRNAAPDDKSNDMHWSDKDICKHFLCGFCPAELFTNTRSDLGPCEKVHDEAMRKAYQQSSRYMKMNYEADFLHYLQQCMQDVERRIKRNHQRLQLSEEKNQKLANPSKDVEDQINILTQRIEEMLQKIEQLGNEGNVEEAQGVMKLCDQLKEDREQLYGQKGNVLDAFSVQEKQMEVCEVCGAFLIVGDAQSRVDDHLMGKQHMGYAKIKAQIEELKEKLRSKPEPAKIEEPDEKQPSRRSSQEEVRHQEKRSRSPRGDNHGSRRRSRSRDAKRDRDRDRDRDRHSRDHNRDRDRDGRHGRDYDRRRSSRDRDRDGRRSHGDRYRDQGRRRSRDRDGRSSDHHSRSKSDKDRISSHRSRSRDRDRDRHSRKHSRPRSKSRDRKDHKRSRRSGSQEERRRRSEDRKDKESSKDEVDKEATKETEEKKDVCALPVEEDKSQECQVSENNNDSGKDVSPDHSAEPNDKEVVGQHDDDGSETENDEPPAPGTAALDEAAPGTEGDQ